MRKKIWSFYTILFFVFVFFVTSYASEKDSSIPFELNLASVNYIGTYNGELTDGLPNGKGTFTSNDGIVFSGQFKEGELHGKIRETAPDGSYSIYKCSSGKPYGKRLCYSPEKELISEDWYYEQELVSSMISNSITPDYKELLADPNSYTQQFYKIDGTVEELFSDWQNIFLLIKDKNDQTFICTYKNNEISRYNQAWVPNFTKGESVVLYGIFSDSSGFGKSNYRTFFPGYTIDQTSLIKLLSGSIDELPVNNESKLSSDQIFSNTYPHFNLFYGMSKDGNKTYQNSDKQNLTYNLISKYPYFYSFETYSSIGTIRNISVDYENTSLSLLIEEEQSKKLIYATYSYDGKDYFPLTGDKISFKAQIKGNYKLSSIDNETSSLIFISIPYLHIYKCEQNH